MQVKRNLANIKIVKRLFFFVASLCLAVGQVAEAVPQDDFHSKYKLVQVIMLSRHNIRAPFAIDSTVADPAEHRWHDFGVKSGELTVHGGQVEEKMGQYCRHYYEKKGLLPIDCQPETIFFYANAFERTIATARHFKAGMFPHENVPINYSGEVGEATPLFLPGTAGHTAAFDEKIEQELTALGGSEALTRSVAAGLKETATVLDNPMVEASEFKVSVAGGLKFSGSIRPFMSACDALTLQYYELADSRASFGHEMNFHQWQKIASVKELGIHVYRHVPTFARAIAWPLLSVFQEELNFPQRKFTFLCGHDTNIATVMGALEVMETSLPESIEQEAPIGSKLVVEKWQDSEGAWFVALKLVYPSVSQLCGSMPINESNPPKILPLQLQDIDSNQDGLIAIHDFQNRLINVIDSDAELMGQ